MEIRRLPFFLLIGSLLWQPAGAARAELVVVVNARCGVAAMTRSEVINVFFGRYRKFFNGKEAEPVDVADGQPGRARFYRLLVGKDLSDVDAYWSRQVFSGGLRPPAQVENSAAVLKWVASHPGGIGYMELSEADARVRVVYELSPR